MESSLRSGVLRRRAEWCREKAVVAEHPRLSEAFGGLADALEMAACVAELISRTALH